MATNKFLPFDQNKLNMQSDATYATETQRLNGVVNGIAKADMHNKLFRQTSIMAAAIGEHIVDAGYDASDDSLPGLKAAFGNAIALKPYVDAQLASKAPQTALNAETTARLAEVAVERARIDILNTSAGDYYIKCLSTDTGALLIVTSGATTGQINLASVTPRLNTYSPVAGDYVRLVSNGLTAELIDLRVGADGKTDTSAGVGARRQFNSFNSDLTNVENEVFQPIAVTADRHDNAWVYDSFISSQPGYTIYTFPIVKGKQYRINRSSYGAIGVGFNNSGFFLNYTLPVYARHDGTKYTFIADGTYNYCHVFIGLSNASIEVFEITQQITENTKKISEISVQLNNNNQKIAFNAGTIDSQTGEIIDSTTRIRSIMIAIKSGDVIKSSAYAMVIALYDINEVYQKITYTEYQSWIMEYTAVSDGYAIIICRKDSDDSEFKPYEIDRVTKSVSVSSYTSTVIRSNADAVMRSKATDGMAMLEYNVSEKSKNILYGTIGKIVKNGNDIVDTNGEKIMLTGIGTHSIGEYNRLYTTETMQTLAYHGINCIRISVYLTGVKFQRSDGRTAWGWINNSEELKPIIENLVNVATEVGLYVILDWHSYHTIDGGNVTQYQSQQEEFFNYFSSLYSNYENILYELHNEPYQNTAAQLLTSVQSCASIIRNNNADAILICGHGSDGVAAMNTLFNTNNGLNIFISPHLYTGEQTVIANIKPLVDNGYPIFVSEWGNSSLSGTDSPNDNEAIAMFNYCHANGISYCLWKFTYQDMDTSVLQHDGFKIDYLYGYGGWTRGDLSHNGKLYFDKISSYRFD